jgi:ATP-dependent helicase HrpA
MLKEKVHLLLKSLPQKLRRHCVPLPDYAAGFVSRVRLGDGELLDRLIADVREQTGIALKRADFKLETLPAHHFMNFKVIDEHGRQLDMGRNLAQLRAELGGRAQQTFQSIAAQDAAVAGAQNEGAKPGKAGKSEAPANAALYSGLTTWNFGELPELLEVRKGSQTLFGYPALVDAGDHCDVEVFDDPAEAARIHHLGLRRLFAIQLREPLKYLEKNIPGLSQMAIQFMNLGTQDDLRDQILDATLERACLQDPLPTDDASFGARKDESRARLTLLAQEIARLVGTILAEYAQLPRKLQIAKPFAAATADIDAQLKTLMHKRFIEATPYAQLAHFPRYLKGIALRIDKLKADPTRDTQRMQEMAPLVQQYQRAEKALRVQGQGGNDPRMEEFRWMLEELRIALFAQELRTPVPMSVKRLQKVWESMQR